ncbi:Sugar phosphate isomerase/epimerase [Paenibacillus sp. UNCCL117]|uniref:sugar phosphate isomerase/epimerase family protein n=1 Tax=unclassified Paenibacillus TaxID=185978 RepID=UPI0008886B18|nr:MULTISPECIES: sugar phosphate isomerase/epimerase [unclassified Paenibacillus]SDE36696.1 Sugar phosphate isomerase/epimerase [Paenibacillus sp. cl123]SFW64793.1 Sugar phosphate isomerase/epimerase [Paenibacillus sp. UNCCL117]
MRKMGIGVQLYTLRNETAADFEGTLRKVAELGYEGVEFAGYGGLSAEDMKALLQELNLKVPGSHVSLERLRSDLQGEIDYMKTIGGETIIVPWAKAEDEEGWKAIIAELQSFGEEVRKQGLGFGYHNHAFEFEGKVGEAFIFDAIFESQPELLVEMDACWVHRGGQDPVAYIRKYAGRLPLVHAKDYKVEDNNTVTLELGQGIVALDEVIAAASEAGVQWLIVEQDNCQNPPLESIANSLNWLKEHYLQRV